MDWEGWVTLIVVVLMIAALARELLSPSATVLCALVVLLGVGVVTAEQAFAGFSNSAPITVAALYVLSRAVQKTGAFQPVVRATLGDGKGARKSLARLVFPTAGASAFLNNTPVVAMLVPQIESWADRRGHSASRYLMPLSFAAILGGTATLLGTSTNLVVSGLLEESGADPLGMFELSQVGVPLMVVGLGTIVLLAPAVLPERRPARKELADDVRGYVVQHVVVSGGPLDGATVRDAGLRHLEGVYLVEITRGSESIAPVNPTAVLHGGDLLTFVGRVELIPDLQGIRGLVSAEQPHVQDFLTARHKFYEAVVGPTSPLMGRTLMEVEFRAKYQAAVVAIHRAGHRIRAKFGEVRLRVGDTLLLLAGHDFRESWGDRRDFLLVSPLDASPPTTTRKAAFVGVVAVCIVVLGGMGIQPVLNLALLGAVALVVAGVVTPGEARGSVDLDVILVIAGSFGLGTAVQESGLASAIADLIVEPASLLGPLGALAGIGLATIFLTALITNNAAAVLMFPIAMSTASTLGQSGRAFAVAVAIAASASFLTPIAYQTNLMVFGPGGYRFGDYIRLGLPVTVVVVLAILFVVPVFWPLPLP